MDGDIKGEIALDIGTKLNDSSKRVRIGALNILQRSISNESHNAEDLNTILDALLGTYNYYNDLESRNEVLNTLVVLLRLDHSKYLTRIESFINEIICDGKSTIALTDYLTLLSWVNKLTTIELKQGLVDNQIKLLNICAKLSFREHKRHGKRVYLSTINSVKHSLNVSLVSADDLDIVMVSLLRCKDPNATLLFTGVLVRSLEDLVPLKPSLLQHFTEIHKKQILDYFKEVLFEKVAPESYSLQNFGIFVNRFVGKEDFEALISNIEKCILRSSEVSFGSILPYFFGNLQEFDISKILVGTKLLGSTLSSLKSNKEHVREGAFRSISYLLQHNLKGSTPEDILVILDEVFKAIKATSNAESKKYMVKCLSLVKSSGATLKILEGLMPLIARDQNETSLASLVFAFLSQYIYGDKVSEELKKKVLEQVKAGLSEKKIPLRNIWFLNLGTFAFDDKKNNSDVLSIVKQLFTEMMKTLEEAQMSPLPTVGNKSITSAHIVIVLADLIKFEDKENLVYSRSLYGYDNKPSIVADEKVVCKLGSDQEALWLARSLSSIMSHILDLSDSSLGFTWLYLLTSNNVSYNVRSYALLLLKEKLSSNLSELLIKCIYEFLGDTRELETFNLNTKYFSPLLSLLGSYSKQNLVNLLVATNYDDIPVNDGWVGLCRRSSEDVGSLVENNVDFITSNCLEIANTSASRKLKRAAITSIGVISFIQPQIVSSKIASLVKSSLVLHEIALDDLLIWRGEEGKLVIDVLLTNTSQKHDHNSKDYETKKWEEKVKKEIASKKSAPKKLTREEQSLVNDQLLKESKIRSDINSKINQLEVILLIIKELVLNSLQIDNKAQTWYPVSVNSVLSICENENLLTLLGKLPIETFLDLSLLLSSRLGNLKAFVGIASLRVFNTKGLDQSYVQESVLDLLSRILFRIKILSDQSLLDELSFSYILPLLEKVIENGKLVAMKNSKKSAVTSEFVEEDQEEALLSLAIEIVSLHAEVFENPTIARSTILNNLISLMALPSKAKSAKECFLSLCQYISVRILPQDLDLLMKNVISKETFVRLAILEGLDSEFDLRNETDYYSELWIAYHDNNPSISELAKVVWDDNEMKLPSDAPSKLLEFSGSQSSSLRLSVASSIYDSVSILKENDPSIFENTLKELINLYNVKKDPPPAKLDRFGLVIKSSVNHKDSWEERSTIALTLKLLAPFFNQELVKRVFEFLVNGLALGDKDPIVRQELQEAGYEIINKHGFNNIESLIPIFENTLSARDEGSKTQDHVRESVVVLYGALARHLDKSDKRLEIIIQRMIRTLDAPSEDIQYAISECISPLVGSFEDKLPSYFSDLFTKLFEGNNLASRRGAAYGIAGLVKGAGIKALTEYDIIRTLTDAADDKKNSKRRESASFGFECLSQSLGKFFEPYVIEILPLILKSLGDSNAEVREATELAARQIMKNTTSFGVKKLIPVAISNLDEIAWRSKKGSVELLGSMAYLDPTQLSSSLSTIVPEIVGVLNDTHKEVRRAADQALKRFGEVIRNPEIQEIVPDLINAIGDPTKYTDTALDKLLKIQFVHYIDGPSLALIIHVIHRGIKDRSAAVKKKACQIVGNMAILVDSKDLNPYLSTLVSELEVAMVDPVPATRSTAARALGSLVEKLGEEKFPDLIPRLIETLQDKGKAGDRLGSAQALSEVICGLGVNKLEELLPVILSSATSPYSHIRAGYMPLLLFLPVCFGSQFSPYLNRIITPILSGLADTNEDIRDTALRAGRLIVKNYATKAVDLLLPELEKGLSDSNYRIRLSSVELTGDLLFQVTGISGKNEIVDDHSEHSKEINKNLIEVLGQDRRNHILSALFMCRSDVALIVRSAAVDIWKALVANTPRTVKEILPTLTTIIVRRLGSDDEVQRTIAAQTLGEMVRRVGANALSQLLPTLEKTLRGSDDGSKQGICIALVELIKSTLQDGLIEYQDIFVRIIRDSLVSPSPTIREAAAFAFEALQDELGKVVIDNVIPPLLNMMTLEDSEYALLGLKEVMSMKSDVIFPILIPALLSPPIDSFKANALSSLASVAGASIYRHLPLIINTLVDAIINAKSEPEEKQDEIRSALESVLLSIDSADGVNPLMQHLLSLAKHEDNEKRAVIYSVLGPFFTNTSLDYSIYLQDMVSQFILSLGDKTPEVVEGTFNTLNSLVKKQSKESLEKLVKVAKLSLELTGVSGEVLAGFAIPKGPSCILPIFLHGLMYGNSEQKELAALGIADIINKTPSDNLKPFATTITGPLIRVIGEKVSSDIKAGILIALNNLLNKIPQFLRPFIPQLQRTFVRSLSDPKNEVLRSRAVAALGTLIEFQPRVDSLITELVTGAKNAENEGVKIAMLRGMLQVITKAGAKMSESSKAMIMALVGPEISNADGKVAIEYAKLVGSVSRILTPDEATSILNQEILKEGDLSKEKFSIPAINSFLKFSPHHILDSSLFEEIIDFIIKFCDSPNSYISDNAILAIGKLILSPEKENPLWSNQDVLEKLMNQLSISALDPNSNSPDTRRLSLVVIRTVARFKFEAAIKPFLDTIAPSVFLCVRDPIIPIRLAAEKAFLSIFLLVEDPNMELFNSWFEGKATIMSINGTSIQPRSLGDYTRRVASRLAGVERERIEDGGDAETMFSDRFEDEKEVWAVGGL
ncbi:uncharacterized protein PRCAT00004698001 [Priceomyces carsonii]|uniref:uncharacterized protein n=1 Tax=Priceomyces carsonii TaxID=28549 RepID=UPI002EDB1B67|nr:unnamed protein product [Priceomyces carsonii]